MPTLEPNVSFEKLRTLLAEGHESEQLDYKIMCDLARAEDLVSLVKDIGAMQAKGGFIVVGADDRGVVGQSVTPHHAQLLDEATLRAKVRKYLDEPIELLSAVYEIDGSLVGLIYVGPNRQGVAIFSADGRYGANRLAFRAGDVFVRHGTASTRWRQSDIGPLFERVVNVRKEEWRREIADSVKQALEDGRRTQDLAAGPIESLDWRLDSDTFTGVVTEQLRRGDDIPLNLALDRMVTDAMACHSVGAGADLETVLDRFGCLAALLIRLQRRELLRSVVDRLVLLYESPMRPVAIQRQGTSAPLWLEITARLEALGGLAVRREAWSDVAMIALLKTPGTERYWPYLLRHAVVSAGRHGLLEPQDTQGVQLVSLALGVARRLSCVRPALPADDERLLESICQFDALAALGAIGDSGAADTSVFYTSFAYYYPHRTEPVLRRLLRDPALRTAIFPHDDTALADGLRTLNHWASSAGLRYSGWHGFESAEIRAFLAAHPDARGA